MAQAFLSASRKLPSRGQDHTKSSCGWVMCGICGSDVQMTSGAGMTYPLGVALGHEFCGEVVECGKAVDNLRVGDRISAMPMSGCGVCEPCRSGRPIACAHGFRMMMGGFGEYTLADARFSVRLPSMLSVQDGALVEGK